MSKKNYAIRNSGLAPGMTGKADNSPVDRQWFSELIRSRGFNSQKDFADKIGLDGPKLTNLLTGKRRPQISELSAMSQVLNTSMPNLFRCFGIGPVALKATDLFVRAAVADNDRVETLLSLKGISEQPVEFPYPDYDGTGIEIRTASLTPRYLQGEILAAKLGQERDPINVSHLLGREVFVQVANSVVFLKILHPGTRREHYNLVSLNPRIPPMIDVVIAWAVPIDFHVPNLMSLKHWV